MGPPLARRSERFWRVARSAGGPAQLQADPLFPQDLLPPAREEPVLGAPPSPALVSSLSPESMSVSPTLGGMRSFCGPRSPLSPCLPHSHPHEAELLEVAALAPEWTSRASPALGSDDTSKGSQGQPSLDDSRRARDHRGLLPPCSGKPWYPGSEMGRLGALGFLLQGAGEG